MSNTASTTDTSKTKGAKNDKPVTKWVDFDTDRELVSFERCEDAGIKPTIEGWVIAEERIKEADEDTEMPAFDCLVMILTAPVELVAKDGSKYTVPEKTVTLVPKSVRLSAIADIANHPTKVYQLRITPTEKVKLEGVKKMRKFKCQINPAAGERAVIAPASLTKLESRLGAAVAAPALPSAPFE